MKPTQAAIKGGFPVTIQTDQSTIMIMMIDLIKNLIASHQC